jgi:hypothetical protein
MGMLLEWMNKEYIRKCYGEKYWKIPLWKIKKKIEEKTILKEMGCEDGRWKELA